MRALLIAVLLLAGCSSPTPGFILAPQVFGHSQINCSKAVSLLAYRTNAR